jgi:hypothetical protein
MSSFIGTWILNNLSLPVTSGSVGTVAQEEIEKNTTPPTSTAIQ